MEDDLLLHAKCRELVRSKQWGGIVVSWTFDCHVAESFVFTLC